MLQNKDKDVEILEELLQKQGIQAEDTTNGITKINGMTVDEYFTNIDATDTNIYNSVNVGKINTYSPEVSVSIEVSIVIEEAKERPNNTYLKSDGFILAA